VPILVDGDFVLWESNAIATYLAEGSPLLPTARRERADVDRWSSWQLAHMGPAIGKVAFQRLVKPLTGQGQPDAKIVEEGLADFARYAGVLDLALGDKPFVAGPLSVADFILASVFSIGVTVGLETAPFPRVHKWLGRVLARPSMQRALAEAQASMPADRAKVA
jgi:glutathione S-transferase